MGLERPFSLKLLLAAAALVAGRVPSVMCDDVVSVSLSAVAPRGMAFHAHFSRRIESKGALAQPSWSRMLNLAGLRFRNGQGYMCNAMSWSKVRL